MQRKISENQHDNQIRMTNDSFALDFVPALHSKLYFENFLGSECGIEVEMVEIDPAANTVNVYTTPAAFYDTKFQSVMEAAPGLNWKFFPP